MPTYEYQATTDKSCSHCAQRFEVVQRMTENALDKCPKCGAPIERMLSAPNIQGVEAKKNLVTNKNLKDKGFTKYVKSGDGTYEKQFGSGPDMIQK